MDKEFYDEYAKKFRCYECYYLKECKDKHLPFLNFCQGKYAIDKVADLEAKLAEKNEAHMKAMKNALNDFLQLRKEQNQTAITELKKVKEKIDYEMAIREGDMNEQTEDVCVLIATQIDQQIKSLKGETDA